MSVMEHEHGRHEHLPFVSEAPPARTLDLGNETVHVQTLEQPGDASGLAAGFGLVSGGEIEVPTDVSVGEALEKVLTTHQGGEQADVVAAGGVETPIGTVPMADRLSQRVHLLMGRKGVIDDGQGVQIPAVGGPAH